MAITLVTGPAVEPVTLDDAKRHLRVDADDDNKLIQSLIVAAREYAETYTHRAFITQIWDLKLDAFPDRIVCPKPPLQKLPTAPVVTYVDTAGATQTWSAALYTVFAPAGPWAAKGWIEPIYGQVSPSTQAIPNAVTVRFYAGYGTTPESVPASIVAALNLLVSHWYEHREAVSPVQMTDLPTAIHALLTPFKAY